jgi:hypothetical protein
LATSIQTAFKRREKALEYLSLFQAGMNAIHNSFALSGKLEPDKKVRVRLLLVETTDTLLESLRTSADDGFQKVGSKVDSIVQFMEENREFVNARTRTRVVRYLKDSVDGATYLLGLTKHRTMIGLRVYALVFTNVFAIIHAPVMVFRLGDIVPGWVLYTFCALTALIPVSLYNFQAAIEYPFDQKGSDDIKLEHYRFRP